MSSKPVSLRIPEEVKTAIAAIAAQTNRSFASVVTEMLVEDLKMRRVRGIYFGDEFERREPKVGGTGLGVWEIIETYKAFGEDWSQFRAYYDWLDEPQLREALEYYVAYPEEIDEHIQQNQAATQEEIWTAYPFTKPGWDAESKPAAATGDA